MISEQSRLSSGSPPSLGDSPLLEALTDEQQDRLTQLLDRYLSALEQGERLDEAALLAEHPDLREALKHYLQSLGQLQQLATAGQGSGAILPTPPLDISLSMRIGDFELIRQLGRGGMGIVYEAKQLSLSRRVALKLLPITSSLDARMIARFQHEARAAAALAHPNIVPVLMVGDDAGVHYYAMHLVEGLSLDEVIELVRAARVEARRPSYVASPEPLRSDGCLVPLATNLSDYIKQVLRIGLAAADALAAAHRAGVIHRDIKPSNLMVEPGGKTWITDFGLARLHDVSSLTQSGDLVGTLRYMSPEQARGTAGSIDHRTDIYSLGATLYELLTLHPAYSDYVGSQLLQQIASGPPVSIRKLCPEIPREVELVLCRAMAHQRDERYASASDFAADLARLIEGEPIPATLPAAILGTSWITDLLRGSSFSSGNLLDNGERAARRKTLHRTRLVLLATAATITLVAAVSLVGMLISASHSGVSDQANATAVAGTSATMGSSPASNSSSLAAVTLNFQKQGNLTAAAETCDLHIKLLESQSAQLQQSFAAREELAAALGRRGLLYRQQLEHQAAADYLGRAIALQEQLVDELPDNTDAQVSLSCLLASRALVAHEQFEHATAKSLLARATMLLDDALSKVTRSSEAYDAMQSIRDRQHQLALRWQDAAAMDVVEPSFSASEPLP